MPRGFPPQPTKLKELKGYPSKRKLDYASTEPEPELGYPEEPEHIAADPIAHNEWESTCFQLDGMGILAKSDRTIIELYCVAYSHWRKALDIVNRTGSVIPVGKTKSLQISPFNTVLKQNGILLKQLLAELGLSPAARARLRVVKEDKPDAKWIGLVA